MTTYYADYVNGSDANNGLGPDATTGNTNKPFKTLTKIMATLASGDTAYLSPAGPFRETGCSMTASPSAETKILGDPGNVQGFKTSAGVLVAPGPVVVTAYTTNDKTVPTNANVVTLNNKNFITFQYIMFVSAGQSNAGITSGGTGGHDVKFLDCAFAPGFKAEHNGSIGIININCPFGVAANWTFDRCTFLKPSSNSNGAIRVGLASGSGSDYDANILVQNCLFVGGNGPSVYVTGSGASAQKGGGVRVRNCTHLAPGQLMTTAGTVLSTTIPCTVTNSFFYGANAAGLIAAAAGQITEDYNIWVTSTGHTSVTAGAHSIADGSYSPLIHFGQERLWGMNRRVVGTPMVGSPLLGFGGDGNQPAYDFQNGLRPAGGVSALAAIGALERANTFGQETGTVRTGANAVSVTGPGTQDFDIPVDASVTNVAVYVRWDATYAGTKPQMKVLNGDEVGVADATATAAGSSGAWEQLTLTFTPTKSGIVTIRLQSNDTNGGGKMIADDFTIS